MSQLCQKFCTKLSEIPQVFYLRITLSLQYACSYNEFTLTDGSMFF